MMKPAKRIAGSILRDQRGASAVEFAIVATPFFFLLMWMLQLGIYFMTQVALDNGLIAEAETIRENLVVGTKPSAATIKAGVVTNAGALISNNSTLMVEIRTLADLDSGAVPIVDGATDYGTTSSTLVLRASGQVISFAPGFGSINTVTSAVLVRRQGS
ncbi:MAG: TadE/TadG family type IV pilus assembly protein [Pseudolabrys sp.]|jgi:Flp pilus assembly protein TadG